MNKKQHKEQTDFANLDIWLDSTLYNDEETKEQLNDMFIDIMAKYAENYTRVILTRIFKNAKYQDNLVPQLRAALVRWLFDVGEGKYDKLLFKTIIDSANSK